MFEFTAEDLAANKRGQLSPGQREWLKMIGESGITTHFVIVGRKKFKFADDMSHVFKEGEKYKFYYCKAGLYEFVLSYEKVEG